MKDDWVGRWRGRTVVCVGSGPSLTEADCERARGAGVPTIVTNTTFKRCPWAEVLFGFDGAWWRAYRSQVDAEFRGARVTCSVLGEKLGAESLMHKPWFEQFGNSGASAISLAITGGAQRVVLIGYDCQRTGGATHWHGDHPKELSNARSIANWPHYFKGVAKLAARKGIEVVNCSRATALECFPRRALEDVL